MIRRLNARRDDRGSVAVIMCSVVLLCAMLAGFVVEVGTKLDVASKADTYAGEAARAAVIAIGPVPSARGDVTDVAAAAARQYLSAAGAYGVVTPTGPASVQITVTVTESTPLLGVSVSATRTHTAQLLIGVSNGEAP
jgi:Flp pilus assembly protein TadG